MRRFETDEAARQPLDLGRGETAARHGRAVLACGWVVVVVLVLTAAILLWAARNDETMDWKLRAASAANVVAVHARQSFRTAGLALDTITEHVTATGAATKVELRERVAQSADMSSVIAHFISGVPQISYVGIADADGNLIRYVGSAVSQPLNVADRDYFQAAMQPGGEGSFIGVPVRSRVDGEWTIFLARQIPAPAIDGRPPGGLGVVLAAIHVSFFRDFYRAINLGEYSFQLLFRGDGVLLARDPPLDERLGLSHLEQPAFKEGVSQNLPQTVFVTSAPPVSRFSDPAERILAVDLMKDINLVAVVAIGRELYLARWYGFVRIAVPAIALICLAILILTVALRGLLVSQARSAAALLDSVAELRRSQEALQHKSAMLDLTFAHMDQGICLISPDGRVPVCNQRAADLLGLPSEVTLGRTTLAEIHAHLSKIGEYATAPAVMRPQLQAGDYSNLPEIYTRQRPNGVLLEIRSRTLPDGGIVRTFTDVTVRTRLEEDLRRSHRMEAVGQLTAGIAHDFNNVLGIIVGNLDLVTETLAGDPEAANGFAEEALEATTLAAGLVRGLLAFSRMQTLHIEKTDIGALLQATLPMLRQAVAGHLEVELEMAECWPTLTDAPQLQSALINLASNARAASPVGSLLRISAENVVMPSRRGRLLNEQNPDLPPGDYVCIAVADQGSGMSAATRERVFEPFFTTKTDGKGTGLGLSMVLGTLQQMDGTVGIESVEGKGTTLLLYLRRAL